MVELDVAGIRRLWKHVCPDLPQPKTDAEALLVLHVARTQSETIPPSLKEYSHAWLRERRKCAVVYAVGVAVSSSDPVRALETRLAMSESVMDSQREGLDLDKDAAEVKQRMLSARARLQRYRRAVMGFSLWAHLPGGSA